MWRFVVVLALVAFTTAYGCLECNKGYTDKDFKALGYRKWNKGMRTCSSYGYYGCYDGWKNPPCGSGGCTGCGTIGCGLPTVYMFIESHAELSTLKNIIDTLGLAAQFDEPFDGTLFLPVNQGLESYVGQSQFNFTDPRYAPFLTNFLNKLLSYHRLPRRVYAAQLVNGKYYPTFYRSANGYPHNLQFFGTDCGGCGGCGGCSVGSCSPCGTCRDPMYRRYATGKVAPKTIWGGKHKGGKWGSYKCVVNSIRDGQGNQVMFDKVDGFVYGGGVIHTVEQVLQPSDIFPSLTAIVSSDDTFSALVAAVGAVDSVDVLSLLETTPGNLAAPINAAFSGIDLNTIDSGYLLQVLAYHFCPITDPADFLLAPYKGSDPCRTLLSSLYDWDEPLQFTQLPWADFTRLPTKQVNFINAARQQDKATIVVADVTTPLHTVVAIDKVMLPPLGLTPRPPVTPGRGRGGRKD